MSNEVLFDVVFKGKHSREIDKEKAIVHFSKLFKLPIEKAQLFFDGKARTLKKSQELEKANHFRQALKKAGIRVSLVKIVNEDYKPELTMSAPGVVIVNQPFVPPAQIDTSDLSVDEVGVQIVEKVEIEEPEFDFGDLDIDEVGVQIVEKPQIQAPDFDVDDITIEEVGATFAEKPDIAEPQLDISSITMEEVGATIVEKEEIPEPDINIEGIEVVND